MAVITSKRGKVKRKGEEGFLVLTRKVNENIVIQGGIIIRVAQIKGDSVKIAIKAPRDVLVLREELQEKGEPAA